MSSLVKFVLVLLPVSWGCSYVEIAYPDSGKTSYLIPRTMELWDLFNTTKYSIDAVPRGGGNKLGWLAPMNIFHFPPSYQPLKCPFEGMNEAGLTVSALYLAQSVYEQPEPGKRAIPVLELVPAILANCSTVDEAVKMLEAVNVVTERNPHFPDAVLKTATLHWAIADPSGRSIIVEYIQGQRMIHENTLRVMTNDPDIKWHWRNLNTRIHLSPSFPYQNEFMQVKADDEVGVVPRAMGHGYNLVGLPGDTTSPSRFIRLFYLRGYSMEAMPIKSFDDAVVLGTGLLNNVWIPFGPAAKDPRAGPSDGAEFTDYGVLKAPKEKVYLIRAYRNTQWRKVDLKRLDFSKGYTWPLEDGSLGIVDITDAGKITTPKQSEL